MKIEKHCKNCFMKQAEAVMNLCRATDAARDKVFNWLDTLLTTLPSDIPPAYVARMVQRRIEQLTGASDPYAEVKEKTNTFALKLVDSFREELKKLDNPLVGAIRLATAGNIIDLGAKRDLTLEEAEKAVRNALNTPLKGVREGEAAERIEKAQRLLIIADNSGEIAFDRLLCEFLPKKPRVAVRSAPIINDATLEDAEAVGITEFADVITTGSDLPGVWLPACNVTFISQFREADLILSKGQGNYEGLNEEKFPGYFLLRVKCDLVSESAGYSVCSNILVEASK